MQKDIKRSFKVLKGSMTENEFNKLCKNIAEQYASSGKEFARTYFTDKYTISKSCFYKVLEYAVVENLVSDATVDMMQLKAIQNQKMHADTAGINSILHYENMRKKRYEKILSSISNEDIRKIATEFAENFEISKEQLAKENSMPIKVIDVILLRAILELIVDEETFAKIRKRSLRNGNDNEQTINFFEELSRKRNAKIETSLK